MSAVQVSDLGFREGVLINRAGQVGALDGM